MNHESPIEQEDLDDCECYRHNTKFKCVEGCDVCYLEKTGVMR